MFAKRLKELREKEGLSQVQLGYAVDLSPTAINKWELELREPTLSSLIALADYFGCSIDYLVGRETKRPT